MKIQTQIETVTLHSRLRRTVEAIAQCPSEIPMDLWIEHANAVVVAARQLESMAEIKEALEMSIAMLEHAARTMGGSNVDADFFIKMRDIRAALDLAKSTA